MGLLLAFWINLLISGFIEFDIQNILQEESTVNSKWPEEKINLFCSTCAAGFNQILKCKEPSVIVNQTINLCIALNITTEYVCQSLVLSNQADFLYILSNTPNETGRDICGVIFVGRGCKTQNPAREWQVDLPDTPKPPIDHTSYPKPGVPTFKVLHLADTHYDPQYAPETNINCQETYLCCRNNSDPSANSEDSSGFWGSYGSCDIPKYTLQAIFDHARTTHPENERASNLEQIHTTANMIANSFPGIQVFPTVGNHEGVPADQFPQPYVDDPKFDISWLYNSLKDIWSKWLPKETEETVAYGAYYSAQIRPGLRILSLNTNYCYGFNRWLIHDSSDIAQELARVVEELQKAEDAGEYVYIIGHIPPGNPDCEFTWSHQFNRIASRYENTISGLFFSHTHKDEFEIMFDPQNATRPYQVVYIGPSQTTYTALNPAYRIYTVEGIYTKSQFRVIDHETWIMDLHAANTFNDTNLFKLYSAKQEYKLIDLSPSSWFDLVKEMNQPNNTFFNSYFRNYMKASPPRLTQGCDNDCKASLLCDVLTSNNSDRSKCADKLTYN